MDSLPAAILDASVRGVNLMPGSLRDQLGREPHLLVFLRYFGCGFCRETIAELRSHAEKHADFPAVLFFFQGRPVEGRAFLRRYWPTARAVSDPELRFYEAFGIRRAGLREAFGPGVWSARRRARAGGHENGDCSGDIWRMPGVFLVQGDRVRWRHEFRHVGDHPDFARIPELAGGLAPAR